jgi:hypothetical protein
MYNALMIDELNLIEEQKRRSQLPPLDDNPASFLFAPDGSVAELVEKVKRRQDPAS